MTSCFSNPYWFQFAYHQSGVNRLSLIHISSGTVVAKHRGAGFLAVPEKLDHFLEEIFAECPLRISVKTRVGVNDAGAVSYTHLDVYKRQSWISRMEQ